MGHIRAAFEKVCEKAVSAERWYVSLVENERYYGGPEEGGWWGTDSHLIAFQEYPTEALAEEAAKGVSKMARQMKAQAQQEHGKHCLNQMEFLEARGLEADFLPEDDGPSEYEVVVSQSLPQERRGCRHYE